MYCYHCGYKLDEDKIESKQSTYQKIEGLDADTQINYVCPRCGHLVHGNASEEDVKSLARACHAELQRGRNDFAKGMSNISIGVILLVASIVFLLLSRKADNQFKITVSSPEFWVFLVLAIISVILLTLGVVFTIFGLKRKTTYTSLLKDINNKTFVQ
ncbi:MAG: hypothetical protein J6N95_02130 [Bacilli bacterium]|nr:hypothetical protein [Bacilli bacterium]